MSDEVPAVRRRLGEVLVDSGLLTDSQLQQLLADQRGADGRRQRLGRLAIERGLATEEQLAAALAASLNLPVLELAGFAIDMEAARLVPRAVCERAGLLVLRQVGSALEVATIDPTDIVALDEVRTRTGIRELRLSVVTESQLRDKLARLWSASGEVATTLYEEERPDEAEVLSAALLDDAPIVRLIDSMIADALDRRASDVHVEPQADQVRIRFRIDGMLRDVMTVPRSALPQMVSRLKIISGLDIAERRRPQDGRSRIRIGTHEADARVSTLPALHGEKVVIRLLARATDMQPLGATGLTPDQLDVILPALASSQGLVLITGPTGSGKTSTLYSGIAHLRTPDRNVVTLEDPVEIALPGITQVQISEKSGLTFAMGLRSVLRQDPDIVLVGETRDQETAELALRASMTGHLVLTTLHTNGAVQAITRLVEMGMEPFLVASSLSLVVAQRLVRRPCPVCAAPYKPGPRIMNLLGLTDADLAEASPRRGRGCPSCGETGYSGRTGVFEVLPVTAGVRRTLMSNPNENALAEAARAAGMLTLRQVAIAAALRGETSFEEVLRTTESDAAERQGRCPACARGVDTDMVCCPWCAAELDQMRCPGCEHALGAGWRRCPYCRTELASAPTLHLARPSGGDTPRLPRVLAVDDDPSVTAFVAAALTGTGEVLQVHTADDALVYLADEEIDLVVLDLTLPDLSGAELVRLLRSDPKTVLVPVLLLTGSSDEEALRLARLAGAEAVLCKPVEPDLLEAKVAELMAGAALRTPA